MKRFKVIINGELKGFFKSASDAKSYINEHTNSFKFNWIIFDCKLNKPYEEGFATLEPNAQAEQEMERATDSNIQKSRSNWITCFKCNGKGKSTFYGGSTEGGYTCSKCNGKGKILSSLN